MQEGVAGSPTGLFVGGTLLDNGMFCTSGLHVHGLV